MLLRWITLYQNSYSQVSTRCSTTSFTTRMFRVIWKLCCEIGPKALVPPAKIFTRYSHPVRRRPVIVPVGSDGDHIHVGGAVGKYRLTQKGPVHPHRRGIPLNSMPEPRIAQWSVVDDPASSRLFARLDSKYSIQIQRHASSVGGVHFERRTGLDDMRTKVVQPCKFDMTDYGTPHL